jgi:PIN domain nuclease of toxin-antitoxin system
VEDPQRNRLRRLTPDELGEETQAALVDAGNSLSISTISTLEIARFVQMGLIELSGSPASWIQEALNLLQCDTIELSHEIAAKAYSLSSPLHKDSADRVFIPAARALGLFLLTADGGILSYSHVRSQDARR